MSKCIKQIRIIEGVRITGTEGTVKLFEKHKNYCYIDIAYVPNMCSDCNWNYKYDKTLHFIVEENGERFYIPDYYAVFDPEGMPEHFRSAHDYFEKKFEQPADWKKAYYELTGIDIRKTERVQYANEQELKEILGNNK